MKSQEMELSALFDDELEGHLAGPLVGAAARQAALRESWRTYALIGDQLRREPRVAIDMTAGVMERLSAEPVILAPRNLASRGMPHPLLALAASVAGVAVVGWLTLAGGQRAPEAERFAAAPVPAVVVRAEVAPAKTVSQAAAAVPVRGEMNEYLLAHQTQAATFRLGHSTEHVRSVSMTGRPVRP